MSDGRLKISLKDALARLPDSETIHTYVNPAMNVLLGADWPRESVINALTEAESIDVTGEHAQEMNHGLAIMYKGDLLFIETAKQPTNHGGEVIWELERKQDTT